jgi:2-phospho-L-lactate guanylyltransferase
MSGGIVALVPVRSLSAGKTRLAGSVTPLVRESLIRRMVRHVIAAALDSGAIDEVVLVSPDDAALALANGAPLVTPLRQRAEHPGLLPALDLGRAYAEARGASGLLVLFGDLPLIEPDDIRNLVRRAVPVVIAADRHRRGTNALFLRLSAIPAGDRFEFQFGDESYARHEAEAHRLGLDAAISTGTGTAFDLDTPDDLAALLADPRWSNDDSSATQEIPLERAS